MTKVTTGTPLDPKQQVVLPQNVLVHVIDGYVILEGTEPFPVSPSQHVAEMDSPMPSAETSEKMETEELQQDAQVAGDFPSGQSTAAAVSLESPAATPMEMKVDVSPAPAALPGKNPKIWTV